jgi:hypothetical protein
MFGVPIVNFDVCNFSTQYIRHLGKWGTGVVHRMRSRKIITKLKDPGRD